VLGKNVLHLSGGMSPLILGKLLRKGSTRQCGRRGGGRVHLHYTKKPIGKISRGNYEERSEIPVRTVYSST